jgi:hypothetical protein
MVAVHVKSYSYWSAEQDAQLRALVAEGVTFRQIGELMGRNRCACIGRAHRIGVEVPVRAPSNSPDAIKKRARAAGLAVAPVERFFRPPQDNKPQPRYELPEASTTAYGEPRRLLLLEPHHCRWPIGDGPSTIFCCADRENLAGPYCREHRLLAWRPTPRQNLAKLAKAYR